MNKDMNTFRSTGMVDIYPAIYALDQKTGIKYFGTIDFANGSKIKWTHVKFLNDEGYFETQKLGEISQNVGVNREATDMIQEIYGIDKNKIRGRTESRVFIDDVSFVEEDLKG